MNGFWTCFPFNFSTTHKLAVIPALRSKTQSHISFRRDQFEAFQRPPSKCSRDVRQASLQNKCQEKGWKYGFNISAMPVVVCSTRYVSHKPKCTRVYKYRITLGPWFDRARYTLKTAQVKPLLCLGRMQTMKTPVYNSVWLAWTACVFISVLYVCIFVWLVVIVHYPPM